MKHQFFGIELAHRFVSSEPPDTHTALLNTKTGDIYYFDEAGESIDDPPEDFHESDDCIAIPHQRDLGLGTELEHRFIQSHAPQFTGRRSLRRFNSFLVKNDLRDAASIRKRRDESRASPVVLGKRH